MRLFEWLGPLSHPAREIRSLAHFNLVCLPTDADDADDDADNDADKTGLCRGGQGQNVAELVCV